jgi:hypothetical protein
MVHQAEIGIQIMYMITGIKATLVFDVTKSLEASTIAAPNAILFH